MEQLLEEARRVADGVDIYAERRVADEVTFENATLKDIDSSRTWGVGLTLVKDGRLGHAFTRNLVNRRRLVDDALASMANGVAAGYELPGPRTFPDVRTYDPAIDALDTAAMVEECERVCEHVGSRTSGELDVFTSRTETDVRVLNSAGLDASTRASEWASFAALRFPGSHASISKVKVDKRYAPLAADDLDDMIDMFTLGGTEVRAHPGRMRVLFMPQAMYTLIWRLQAATGGRQVYEGVSPLTDRLGEPVFDARLTIEDRPLDDALPGARSFDDEGTPCANRAIVDAGVLRGFCFDRYFAWRAGREPTGNGYRPGIDHRARPELRHLTIRAGAHTFSDLLKLMGRGVIVVGAMGAHSGNLLNGDYSIGLAPGLYVEGGEIVGRVKDAMVAGNIYETMKQVVAVGDSVRAGPVGWFPPVVFDDVSVSVRA